MKYKIKIIVAISVLCVVLLLPVQIFASPLEDQLENIKQEKEQNQQKLDQIKESESELLSQVETVEEQYMVTLSEVDQLNQSLNKVNKSIWEIDVEIEEKNKELDIIEKELQEKVQVLNRRAASIYKYGNSNLLELLMGTEGFLEFFSKFKLMDSIAQEDLKIIKGIKGDRMRALEVKKNILNLKDDQKENKKEIENLILQAEAKNEEIESIYNKKKTLLDKTQQDKEALLVMDRQLTAKENEVKNILMGMTHGVSPGGNLLWPTNGRISSPFGPRGGRMHNGIDIYCSRGTPIMAADSGQVIQVSYHGGYGNCILIYHGGGFATFYAHLDGFAISAGQPVTKGQTIGYVGTTGWTTGPHLHFEVRINGVPRNPMSYF